MDRVQQIINSAYKFGRKVAVEGRSMVNVITTATELGYLKIPDKTLVEIDQIKNYPDEAIKLTKLFKQWLAENPTWDEENSEWMKVEV